MSLPHGGVGGVATVTPSGVVEALSVGATEVTARSAFDGSKRDTIPVTVVAAPLRHAVSVTLLGSGTGTVSSVPAGIACGEMCDADFDDGEIVTLTASASDRSVFEGWGGACSGTGLCTLGMSEARSVTATFDSLVPAGRMLEVTRHGSGLGTVSSSPAGIDCGSACLAQYEDGTSVTLTANAAAGSSFTGWGGACGGADACTLSMTEALSATASFEASVAVPRSLSVALAGTGLGTVTSSPSGIDCGATCAADFEDGTSVTLTASATAGSTFVGWSGACAGVGTCSVSMTEARTVTATFDSVLAEPRTLTVTRGGTGSGTVTSSPAGIDCGSACSAQFAHGTGVTLTATPASGSNFYGWSGACSGTSTTCTVSMTQYSSVTATFTLQVVLLPLNDNFANSFLLTGVSGSRMGYNRGATKETGEPNHAYTAGAWNAGGKSVWWRWTAPFTGWIAFDTFGSDFDTMLGVYTGSAVHQLTLIAYSDDASGTPQSMVVFPVSTGVTYQIAVDG